MKLPSVAVVSNKKLDALIARYDEKPGALLGILEDAQELGAGYRIAIKDLELRGAGNILGREQSGAINKIGLNLYSQLLSESIEKFKS